jgi:hypothetical protein
MPASSESADATRVAMSSIRAMAFAEDYLN